MNAPIERVIAVLSALFLFGLAYNALVDWLEREAPDHGYTSFLVVGGVVATLSGAATLIGLEAALLVGLAFAASGLPMIAGSVWRTLRRRARERDLAQRAALELLTEEA